jgi:hypothetical protein
MYYCNGLGHDNKKIKIKIKKGGKPSGFRP